MGIAGRDAGRAGASTIVIVLPYSDGDFDAVVALWREAGMLKPYNDPKSEIARVQKHDNCLLSVGRHDDRVMATVLVGHDGYRGWIYKLAVAEALRGRGHGKRLGGFAATRLGGGGTPHRH